MNITLNNIIYCEHGITNIIIYVARVVWTLNYNTNNNQTVYKVYFRDLIIIQTNNPQSNKIYYIIQICESTSHDEQWILKPLKDTIL